jgi:serine/threonine-protein kinase RsbW
VSEQLRLKLRSALTEIQTLQQALADFAVKHHLSVPARDAVTLAAEEAVTNIITHGYQGAAHEFIWIDVELSPDELLIRIEDGAPAYNPLLAPKPDLQAPLAERKPGGLGVYLSRQVVDALEYRRLDGKNQLTIRKRLAKT